VLGLTELTLGKAPENVKILAYKTLCRLLLEYAAEVWDLCSESLITKLKLLKIGLYVSSKI